MGTFVTTSAEIEGFNYYDLDDPPDWIVEAPTDANLYIRPVTSGMASTEILNGSYAIPFSTDFAFSLRSIAVTGTNSGHTWTFELYSANSDLDLGEKIRDIGAFLKTQSSVQQFTLPEPIFINQGYFYVVLRVPNGVRSACANTLAHSRLNAPEVPKYPATGALRRFVTIGGLNGAVNCPYIILGVE